MDSAAVCAASRPSQSPSAGAKAQPRLENTGTEAELRDDPLTMSSGDPVIAAARRRRNQRARERKRLRAWGCGLRQGVLLAVPPVLVPTQFSVGAPPGLEFSPGRREFRKLPLSVPVTVISHFDEEPLPDAGRKIPLPVPNTVISHFDKTEAEMEILLAEALILEMRLVAPYASEELASLASSGSQDDETEVANIIDDTLASLHPTIWKDLSTLLSELGERASAEELEDFVEELARLELIVFHPQKRNLLRLGPAYAG